MLHKHRNNALIIAGIAAVTGGAIFVITRDSGAHKAPQPTAMEVSSQAKRTSRFQPTPSQWAALGMEPVKVMSFRAERLTEGKISINEDKATPVYPPYAGRVTRLMAKPGDMVEKGQALFYIEANDMVAAQNEFLTALGAINKARSSVSIAEIIEKQNRSLYDSKAGPLRDFQTAQATLVQARADLQNAESSLEASRNRLTILGKTEQEIEAFKKSGRINSETPIYAPLSGTVVQRKVGPGQYVSYTSTGAVDPVYTIGDLTTVWMVAYVRESDAPLIKPQQELDFGVMAYPKTVFRASIDYVSASLDPSTRRLQVRATIDNGRGVFKPEMFTSVTIYTDDGENSIGVPREAVIYEADNSRVWVARPDKTVELRQVKTGLSRGAMVQITQGLQAGDTVVTRGTLFVDQEAGS